MKRALLLVLGLVCLAAAQSIDSDLYQISGLGRTAPTAEFYVPTGEPNFVNWKCFTPICPARTSDLAPPTSCKITFRVAFPNLSSSGPNATVYFGAFSKANVVEDKAANETKPVFDAKVTKIWKSEYSSLAASALSSAVLSHIDIDVTNGTTAGLDAPYWICSAMYEKNMTVKVRVAIYHETVYPLVKSSAVNATLSATAKGAVASVCGPQAGYGDAGALPNVCGPLTFTADAGATVFLYPASAVTVSGSSFSLKDANAAPLAQATVIAGLPAAFQSVTDKSKLPLYAFATLSAAPAGNETSALVGFRIASRSVYPATTSSSTIPAGSSSSGGMSQRAIVALIVAIVAVVVIIVAVVSVIYCMRAQTGRESIGHTVSSGRGATTVTV
eukprot:tig00021537_g22275.t1